VLKIIILILQTLCAIGLIATVLLQSGKSAGLSGSIAGGSEVIFGKKKGVDDLFAKITAYLAALFLLLSLALAVL
jgi:preprotein translocase subunit SecG